MKKFNMVDEGFICLNCGKKVNNLGYSARNHCPYCLTSLHVDNNPGDRSNKCMGLMTVIGWEQAKKGEIKLIFKCSKCGMIKKNKMAIDDDKEVFYKIIGDK